MIVFGPGPTRSLAEAVSSLLEADLADVDVTIFEDGERRIRPVADVAARHTVVVQSVLTGGDVSVHDELCQLLFLVAALNDIGAASVTLVVRTSATRARIVPPIPATRSLPDTSRSSSRRWVCTG